jgi:hypothetical protein
MRRAGFRGRFPIPSYETCQREPSLQVTLKPAWRMTLCWRLPIFIYFNKTTSNQSLHTSMLHLPQAFHLHMQRPIV